MYGWAGAQDGLFWVAKQAHSEEKLLKLSTVCGQNSFQVALISRNK